LETAANFRITDEEYRKALDDMRNWGRKMAVDRCLAEYEVDVMVGPADSRINEFSSAAGR
jgi:amidase